MISAFDHPFLSGLLGDDEIACLLGAGADIAAMLRFEAALAEAQAGLGLIPAEAAAVIGDTLKSFQPNMAELGEATKTDGVVVPNLVRQIKLAVGEPHAVHVHFGTTSQDVVDSAFVLRLLPCLALLDQRLACLAEALAALSTSFGDRPLAAHTRMQPAIPIRAADRIENWRAPLLRHRKRLRILRRSIAVIQFGGAAGTLDMFGESSPVLRASLASRLGLADRRQWHSQRDRLADLAGWLSLVTGSLGKFGEDVALMAQAGVAIELAGGGSSSAMPHKQNPVSAEMLVTLARFNAVQVSAVHHALLHEQERSGSAWTLEWLVIPLMLQAAGAATLTGLRLSSQIVRLGNPVTGKRPA